MEGFNLSENETANNDLISDDQFNILEFMDFDGFSFLSGSPGTSGDQVIPSPGFSSLVATQSETGFFPALSSPFAGQNTGSLLVSKDVSSRYDPANSGAMDRFSRFSNVPDKNITDGLYHSAGHWSETYDVENKNSVSYLNRHEQISSGDVKNSSTVSDLPLMKDGNLRGDTHHEEDCFVSKNAGTRDWTPRDSVDLSYDKGIRIGSRSLGFSLAEKMLKALSLFMESSGTGILAQVWVPVKRGNEYVLSTSEQPYLLDQILTGYREVSRKFSFSAIEKPGSFPGLPGRVYISRMPEWTSNVGYYHKGEYLRVNHALAHEVCGSLALPVFEHDQQSCCAVLEIVTKKEKANFVPEMENVCNALRAVNLRTMQGRICPQNHSTSHRAALAEISDVLKAVCHAHKLPLAQTWVPYRVPDVINGKSISRENGADRWRTVLCVQDSACYVSDTHMQGFVDACSEHYLEKGQGIAGKALESNHPFFCPDVKEYDMREYPLAHHARKFGLNAAVAIRLRSTYSGDDDYIVEFFLPVNCKGSSEQKLLLDNLAGTMQKICKSLRTLSDGETVESGDDKIGIQKGSGKSFSSINMPRRSSQLILFESELDSSARVPMKVQHHGISEMEADMNHQQNMTCSSKQPEKKRSTAEKNISLAVLQQYFSGSLKDAAKATGVCPTTLKRICRQHGISRWPSRKINRVNRSLKKIRTVIESVQGVDGSLRYDPITGGLIATSLSSQNNPVLRNTESEAQPAGPGSSVPYVDKGQQFAGNAGQCKDDVTVAPIDYTQGAFSKDNLINERSDRWDFVKDHMGFESSDCNEVDAEDGMEHNQPSSSGMMDSCNGSDSMMDCTTSSSQSKKSTEEVSSRITVKATFKEDTVRFKFTSSMGCLHLFEEVGKRFKLPIGTFQLRYLDDEDEWVMLANDEDLKECIEILDSAGSPCVKLMVRDFPCLVGSSVGSTCGLLG